MPATTPGASCRVFEMIRRAEAQRVHVGDRPRAHREHVAHDAADARRRALEWLDVGRVIMELHLGTDAIAVAEIDDARILAGPWMTFAPDNRQRLEPHARGCTSSARST